MTVNEIANAVLLVKEDGNVGRSVLLNNDGEKWWRLLSFIASSAESGEHTSDNFYNHAHNMCNCDRYFPRNLATMTMMNALLQI